VACKAKWIAWVLASCLEGLGEIAFGQGQATWTVWLFRAAEALRVSGAHRISPKTVNVHVASIYKKLEITSRTSATRCAIEHDLV
jgi:hypothetical protein